MSHSLYARIRARSSGSLQGRYADFQAASHACADQGYEAPDVVGVVARKTARLRNESPDARVTSAEARILLAIACAASDGAAKVRDFGGACGGHFLRARAFFGDRLRLQWAVVETPKMISAAHELGLDDEVSFHPQLSDAVAALGKPDLLLCSGALQYVPDVFGMLDSLLAVGARATCLTRLPLTDSGVNFYCLQRTRLSGNGPGPLPEGFTDVGLRYPMAVIDCTRLEQRLHQAAMTWTVISEEGLLHHPAAGYIRFATYLGRS